MGVIRSRSFDLEPRQQARQGVVVDTVASVVDLDAVHAGASRDPVESKSITILSSSEANGLQPTRCVVKEFELHIVDMQLAGAELIDDANSTPLRDEADHAVAVAGLHKVLSARDIQEADLVTARQCVDAVHATLVGLEGDVAVVLHYTERLGEVVVGLNLLASTVVLDISIGVLDIDSLLGQIVLVLEVHALCVVGNCGVLVTASEHNIQLVHVDGAAPQVLLSEGEQESVSTNLLGNKEVVVLGVHIMNGMLLARGINLGDFLLRLVLAVRVLLFALVMMLAMMMVVMVLVFAVTFHVRPLLLHGQDFTRRGLGE